MPLLDGRVSSRVEQRIRLPVTSIVSNGGSHFASGLRLLMLTRMVPIPADGKREDQSFAGSARKAKADLVFADWVALT